MPKKMEAYKTKHRLTGVDTDRGYCAPYLIEAFDNSELTTWYFESASGRINAHFSGLIVSGSVPNWGSDVIDAYKIII